MSAEALEQRIRSSFARQGLMATLGAEVLSVAPGRVAVRLPHGAHVLQQHGFFHGGVVGTIADVAGGYAALTLMPAESSVLTVEYKINFMAPAQGPALVALGEVVRAGRTLTVVEVRVRAEGAEKDCALMVATMIRVEPIGEGD